MKISQMLEQHHKFSRHGLAESFGDGYLVAHNRFFRHIREAALAAGFRFSSERNEAFDAFPLLQLENILRVKVLPYANNIAAFEQLTPVQLSVLGWQDIDGNLKKNFVFHEACHAAVRSLIEKNLKPINEVHDIKSQRLLSLRMLIEESCANTCELLGTAEVQDQTHRLFFQMNSYMEKFDHRTYLKNALTDIGEPIVIKFITLAYLQANFLRERIEDRDFTTTVRIAGGAQLEPKQLKTLRALSKIAFQLSERFRLQTTSFHLRLAGIKTPIADLFDFDFLAELKNKQFDAFLQQWVGLIHKG